MPTALQLPYTRQPAKQTGPRLFRKQVLPLGGVEHPSKGRLEFTPDLLDVLVAEFTAGAMTQVPFVLANERGEHNDDPERFRGEVKGLEARDDGLYAEIELTERGAQLVADNPSLPVSVRILPEGPKGRPTLGHICGTLDEVAKGMKPWEAIEASAGTQVVDLSGEAWYDLNVAGTDATTEKQGPLTEEESAQLRALLKRVPATKDGEDDKPKPEGKDKGKSDAETPEITDEEAERLLANLLGEGSGEGDEDKDRKEEDEREPIAASLSDKDREVIELAEKRAKDAERKAGESQVELAKARFEREADQLIHAGVPPADVELARPLLEAGDPQPIELSNGQKVDPAKVVRDLLAARKGTIDFSERGSSATKDETDEAKEMAEAWHEAAHS